LELPHGIPSHDTIGRLSAQLNPKEFEQAFLNWIKAVKEICKEEIVALDGKTLRRSYDKNSEKAEIHMVSAWASKNRMILGQIKTNEKSDEITAIPELLRVPELEGCIVTIDAMGGQKDIVKEIRNKNADYVIALKGNQGKLHHDVKLFFEDAKESDFKDIRHSFYETTDGDHGRIEIRRYWTVSDIDWIAGKEFWKDLNMIGMAECERHTGNRVSTEIRYYISSLNGSVKKFASAVREHWGIENSLHWVPDVSFREDDCRIRKDHAPENFAIVRHIALNMLRRENTQNSVKLKRFRAGWDDDFLQKIVFTF